MPRKTDAEVKPEERAPAPDPRTRPFGMVTRWKGVFTLEILKFREPLIYDVGPMKFDRLARCRAKKLDQILEHAKQYALKSVRVMVEDSTPRWRKGVIRAAKNRR
jgi:hypothetical protein